MSTQIETIASAALLAVTGGEDAAAPVYVPVDAAAAAYLTHAQCIRSVGEAFSPTWTGDKLSARVKEHCPLPPFPAAK